MANHGKRGPVQFKNSAAFVADGSAAGKKIGTLSQALAQETSCGCGIECECFGFLKLRNWNSVTGEYDYRVLYFADGALVVTDQADAETVIAGYKSIAGGLVRGPDTTGLLNI